MAAVLKVFRTIRTHWKKSIFFSVAISYGAYYFTDRYRSNLIRRALCEEALKYGNVTISPILKPKKVFVVLNPAAKKGKAFKLFQQNAAPMLHLAGISVEVYQTDDEGDAKEKMQYLDDVDAIIVVGGDGTLSEVVTGLLRRDDYENVCKWPIGVIPAGHTNTLARVLYSDSESVVRWMGGATLSIIKGWVKPLHVMRIEGEGGKVVYAMNSIQWGQYTDTKEQTQKYKYFGPLKHRVAYLFKTLKGWPPLSQAELSYTPACDGCNQCKEPVVPPKVTFWTWLVSWIRKPVKEEVKDYSQIFNAECGLWHDMKISAVEFTATTSNITPESQDKEEVRIKIGPDDVTKNDFITEGWTRIKEKSIIETQERSEGEHICAKEFKLTPSETEGQDSFFFIDNEKFETMPVHIKLQPRKLQFYYNNTAVQS